MHAGGRLTAGALTGLFLVFAAPNGGWASTGAPPDPGFPAPGSAAPPPAMAPAPPVFPPPPSMQPVGPHPTPVARAQSTSYPQPADPGPVVAGGPAPAADAVTYDFSPVDRVLTQAARPPKVAVGHLAPPVSGLTAHGGRGSPPGFNAIEIGPGVGPQPGDYVPALIAGGLLSAAVWLAVGWRARGRRARA